MGTRALNNRIEKVKELERQKAELEKQIDSIKAEIKEEMENNNINELDTGLYIVRFKDVTTNRFDSKAFKIDHIDLYNEYLKAAVSKRFSIA